MRTKRMTNFTYDIFDQCMLVIFFLLCFTSLEVTVTQHTYVYDAYISV